MLGVIPGRMKPGFHAKLHNTGRFAGMLLDLAACISPCLTIMDAGTTLEGEGPGITGTPRHVGLLLASRNPLALDIAAGEIIGLKAEDNPLLMQAQRNGIIPHNPDHIERVTQV